jgi:hypothetical protein
MLVVSQRLRSTETASQGFCPAGWSTWLMMNPAPSEARKLTAWAMSSVVPIRAAGTEAR